MARKAPEPKKPRGRPTLYTDKMALTICAKIASGVTLIEICEPADMPDEVTVRGWDLADRQGWAKGKPFEGFSALYARARLMGIEHEVDETKVIGDRPQMGEITTTKTVKDANGNPVEVTETRREDMLGHRKLQIDTRKWRASKIAWRDYGERLGQPQAPDEGADNRVIIEGGLPVDED